MSSLLGHVLGAEVALGFAAPLAPEAARSRRAIWMAGVLSIIPDLDVGFFIIAGKPDWLKPHVGISHSLLFAFMLGLLGMLFLLKRKSEDALDRNLYVRAAIVMFAVTFSHLLMDCVAPTSPGNALPLLWPFSAELVESSVQILPTAYYSDAGLVQLVRKMFMHWKSWVGMLIECLILVPLLVMAWKRILQRSAFWTLAAVSAGGMVLSFVLYSVAKAL